MDAFIHEDFLLQSESARALYHGFAARQPILDYHCHLSPEDIAENRQFNNLFEIWLEGDHYKWRAMRANGVEERYCTGDASPCEKFMAWARTVPNTLRNPLYHWTHLELKRYFGIEELLDEETAPSDLGARQRDAADARADRAAASCGRFDVRAFARRTTRPTTFASPADCGVEAWRRGCIQRFGPTRRCWWISRRLSMLGSGSWKQRARWRLRSLADFLDALRERHDVFHAHGRAALGPRLERSALSNAAEDRSRGGSSTPCPARRASAECSCANKFAQLMMLFFGRLDAEKGWTKQLHLGALRNDNARMSRKLGRGHGLRFDRRLEAGCSALAHISIASNPETALPKMIVYNINPADNYAFATMMGNFQDGRNRGQDAIRQRLVVPGSEGSDRVAAQCALELRTAYRVSSGMLTDSRSFMSYPRHEYFRRVLCNLLGDDIERGELPGDMELIGRMVRDICYNNVREYLGLEVGTRDQRPGTRD